MLFFRSKSNGQFLFFFQRVGSIDVNDDESKQDGSEGANESTKKKNDDESQPQDLSSGNFNLVLTKKVQYLECFEKNSITLEFRP